MYVHVDPNLLRPTIKPEKAQQRMFQLIQIRNEQAERAADRWTMDQLNLYVEVAIRRVKRLERMKHRLL